MAKQTEIVIPQHEVEQTTPSQLIQLAIQKDVDIEKLEKLMQLQERYEANIARKKFYEAMATFQKKCPVIKKTKQGHNYKYAPLDQIVSQIKDLLFECGLSYRFEIKDIESNQSATCIITHKEGHSESTSMSAGADKSGSKNDIQARGSSITYLQRYTLIGALGISTAQDDVDGGKKKDEPKLDTDMEVQINDCRTLDELKKVWESYPLLSKDSTFNKAINERKAEIIRTNA